ncbi:MAG: SDR family oxidoreductase [Acidimicrobiia bacterium]
MLRVRGSITGVTTIGGTHAFVTGGSSGIGLETARLLAARGATVSLLARDQSRLAVAEASIRESVAGATVGTVSADVRDGAAVRAAVAAAVAARGPVDIVATAAGYARPGYFAELPDDAFRDQVDVDYFGTLHVVRATASDMVARGRGHIVMVASTAALIGVFGYSAYAPAKYAVRGLAETLRPELAPHGIVVACAYPPDTDTPGLAAENEHKPVETARLSAAIEPRTADAVARAVVRGIERNRLVITADVQTAALARAAGLLGPYVRWSVDRTVRRARKDGGTFGP